MCYGGQQDASTRKVSLVSQPSMCHNSPQNSHPVNPKSTPENSMHGSSNKVNTAQSSVNLLTLVFVPMSMTIQNRTLHQISALLDHALTKVNAGQTSMETLAVVSCSKFGQTLAAVTHLISHIWTKFSSKELVLNHKRRCVWWEWVKWSPTLTVYISIIEVCDTSVGGVKP